MKGLKYISWGDNTGYAVAARNYLAALRAEGIPITWLPMLPGGEGYVVTSAPTSPDPALGELYRREIDYDAVLIHTVPEYFPDWIDRERAAGRRVFGYTVWELERLPGHWPAILNRLDGVLVPCRWNADVFRRSGVTVPIHVIPHLLEAGWADPPGKAEREAFERRLRSVPDQADRFVFYTIGYWSNRKAPYLALEAYLRAFRKEEPVLLVIKTSRNDITRWVRHLRSFYRLAHPSPTDSVRRRLKEEQDAPPVVVIADETLSMGEMSALHARGDCYISLARAEGWGLGAFEAASLGKPVITTGYGGHLDFLSPEFTRLVDFTMVPVHEPTWSSSYSSGDIWAEPSVSQAAGFMRGVFEDPQAARQLAATQAGRIKAEFAPGAVARQFVEALA